MNPDLLTAALGAAVPLHIHQLRAHTGEQLLLIAHQCGDDVASHGDDVLYRGHQRGDTARAFNALAKGIAVLAYAPGGVTAFGQHWQAEPVMSTEQADRARRDVVTVHPINDLL